MEWKQYEKDFNDRCLHVKSWLEQEYAKLRTGKVTGVALEHIRVNAYDELVPINNIANISSPEPRVLIIKAYDASLYKSIAAAINASDLGVNPQIDADKIRLSFPPLTEETRKEIAKKVKVLAEEAKVKIRRIRQDIQDCFKKEDLSDDDKKYFQTALDKVTKEQNEKTELMCEHKTKEILSI